MVDDEEPLCLGVRRILDKYKVHVADVGVDVAYEFGYFTSGEEFLAWLARAASSTCCCSTSSCPGMNGLDVLTP